MSDVFLASSTPYFHAVWNQTKLVKFHVIFCIFFLFIIEATSFNMRYVDFSQAKQRQLNSLLSYRWAHFWMQKGKMKMK